MAKKKEILLADSGVIFNAADHTYTLNGKQLNGITSTLINRAYPTAETYKDVPEDVLQAAADRGSACHSAVQTFYLLQLPPNGYDAICTEAQHLLSSQELTPLKWEYVVTDYLHYASPIDIVCLNAKGEICIVDMKFTARLHIPQVTLQTTLYRRFFSLVNPKLTAKHLYALWVHTGEGLDVKDSGIYELSPVEDTFLDDLIQADTDNAPFDITRYYGELPARVAEVEDYLASLTAEVKAKTDELNTIKDGLTALMLQNRVKTYQSDRLTLTAVTPKPRQSFDSKAFQADHPDMYRDYIRTSEVKPSVRITIR